MNFRYDVFLLKQVANLIIKFARQIKTKKMINKRKKQIEFSSSFIEGTQSVFHIYKYCLNSSPSDYFDNEKDYWYTKNKQDK